MGRKKRRSSKFRDSSAIIDIEQARQERQERQAERQKKKKKMEARSKPRRSAGAASRKTVQIPEAAYRPKPDPAWEEDPAWDGNSVRDEAPVWDETASGEARESAETAGSRIQDEPDMSGGASGEAPRRPTGSATGSVAGDTAGEAGIRQDRRRRALSRRRRTRAMFVMGVVLALVLLVGFSLGHIVMLKYDLHVARKEQEQYKEEKAQLEKDMQQINDLDSLEEQARDQMRLIKPGETLYIFPEEMAPQEQETEDPEETGDADEKKDRE